MTSPEPGRLLLLLALVGSLLTPAAAADAQATEVAGVRCTASYSWPDLLCFGYFPVPVVLVNPTDQRVVVEIEASQMWGQEDRVTKTAALEPGERFEFEMLLRARSSMFNQYVLKFAAGDQENIVSGRGPEEYSHGTEQVLMYFSPENIDQSTAESWASDWSARTGGPGEVHIGAGLFTQMSSSWEAYSSLDSVVLDLRDELPAAEQLEAVVAWARSGGRLILAGPDLPARLEQVPSIAGWLEERFEIPFEQLKGSSDPRVRVFHAGTGYLVLAQQDQSSANPMKLSGAGSTKLAFEAHELDLAGSWVPAAPSSRSDSALSSLSGFGNLPLRGLMVLLVLFALVMGPVNFLWVRRVRKPMMLLVTVPGIAVVTSLGLIGYGILSQGLDVKSMTRSWSVLDQRANHATTAEVRRLFAGSSPGVGLRPERGTAVFPEARFWRGSYNRAHLFTQDLDDGRLFGGDYLMVRQPMGQLLLSDRTARVRLEARYVGEEIEVSNALGAAVLELFLRAPDGEYHELRGNLEPGAGARLVPTSDTAGRLAWSDDLNRLWGQGRTRLAPGTYLARLETAALQDDCGVTVNEVEGRHVVMGILDGEEGAWR